MLPILLSKFSARFLEPSTWAGIAGLALALKAFFPAMSPILDVAAVVAGALAAKMPDATSSTSSTPSTPPAPPAP